MTILLGEKLAIHICLERVFQCGPPIKSHAHAAYRTDVVFFFLSLLSVWPFIQIRKHIRLCNQVQFIHVSVTRYDQNMDVVFMRSATYLTTRGDALKYVRIGMIIALYVDVPITTEHNLINRNLQIVCPNRMTGVLENGREGVVQSVCCEHEPSTV